jgi:hypothetical protein
LPRAVGDREGLREAHRGLVTGLVPLTRVAAGDVSGDLLVHARPVEATSDLFDGLVLSEVTRGSGVVTLVKNPSLEW